jgi:hypothetical protein
MSRIHPLNTWFSPQGKRSVKLPLTLLTAIAVTIPSLSFAQQSRDTRGAQTHSNTTNRSNAQVPVAVNPQNRAFELEAGRGGALRCILTVTLEEGNPWTKKTAEYTFDIPGDGHRYAFDLGPKVPVQTSINTTISAEYIQSGTRIEARGRLVGENDSKAQPSIAWFELYIDYSRVLERLATFANLPSTPYREVNHLETSVVIRGDSQQELYTYDDGVVGRKLRIAFQWSLVEAPDMDKLLVPSLFDKLRCTLAVLDNKRSVRQTFLVATPSPYGDDTRSFISGVSIPVETVVNATKSIQYIDLGVGAHFRAVHVAGKSGVSDEIIQFPLYITYARLQERTFVAKAEMPYGDQVSAEVDVRLRENQEKTIFSAVEPIRGDRTFNATFSWRHEVP